MLRSILAFLGLHFDSVAIGLLGGWYMKGHHRIVVDFAIKKIERCDLKGNCDDFSAKYFLGYAILSARELKSSTTEETIQKYMKQLELNEKDCIDMVSS